MGRPRQLHPEPVHSALSFPRLTDREFSLLRALIKRETGIHLSSAKRSLVAGRLMGRPRALGLPTFGAYYRYLQEAGNEELEQMIDCISTNETSFFREPEQFSLLQRQLLPRWREEGATGRRRQQLHVWCAGCSTGEEPYSIAMLLADCFPPGTGWDLAITASDISRAALGQARAGIWSARREAEIPESCLKRFMLRGQGRQAGKMKAGPEISALIRFQHLNLVAEEYPLQGPFDLIFCRNVLMYFDKSTRLRVTRRLLDHLAPSGLLLLGHAESLSDSALPVRCVMPTVYAFAPGAEPVAMNDVDATARAAP